MEYLSPEWQAELNKLVAQENARITNLLVQAMTEDDMTTNPRFRAGQPASCAFVRSGCNWPEGGCAGNCMTRRVDASQLEDGRAVMVAGDVESKYANSPMPYTDIRAVDDEEDGPEEMLAAVIVLAVACVGLGFFITGVLSWGA